MTDDSSDDELLRRVLRHDDVGWMQLFTKYGPVVERIIRSSRSMGSYRRRDDDVRNVMASVFERLRRDDFRALRTFDAWRAKNPGKAFSDWLTIVTVNVARNYVAAKLGTPSEAGTSIKQLVNTLADAFPEGGGPPNHPHMTTKETARQIGEYAREHLPRDQLDALQRWLEGKDFDEIARELGLADARTADRLVRAALARLRREFDDEV
jgi:hypothetical protein